MAAAYNIQSLGSEAFESVLEDQGERVQASGAERADMRNKTTGLAQAIHEHDDSSVAGDRSAIRESDDLTAALIYVREAPLV